ncbi:MAG: hypothetical protein WCS96_14085 [Victivallales bacterium]
METDMARNSQHQWDRMNASFKAVKAEVVEAAPAAAEANVAVPDKAGDKPGAKVAKIKEWPRYSRRKSFRTRLSVKDCAVYGSRLR